MMLFSEGFVGRIIASIAAAVISAIALPAFAAVHWIQTSSPTPLAFEDEANWTPTDYAGYVAAGEPGYAIPPTPPGPELTPPGEDSTWFMEGSADSVTTTLYVEPTRNGYNGVVRIDSARDGSNSLHPKLGAGAIGGGYSNEITTLIINANVTVTGAERTNTGAISGTIRQMRVGQQDWTDDNVFPWGIVKQTHGHVLLEMADANGPSGPTGRGDLLITNDKAVSAGGIWEVGGDASLRVPSDVQIGQKGLVKSAGGIFRIRGSNVGTVGVGDRFQLHSQTAVFDTTAVDLGGGYRHKFNRGKSVAEFVLDANGVSPITVEDNLDLGSNATVTLPEINNGAATSAIMPAFLRIKLSQPTMKGAGEYNPDNPGSGDVIVLFNADRISSAITTVPEGAEELLEGRFFGPDHTNDAGTAPHRALLDGARLKADYAGAQYSWQINYYESSGGTQDAVVDPAVILSGLQLTGTLGDLNGDSVLNELDRTALANAIAAPPASHYDLLGGPQHLFDLNGDDVIDSLDMATFNTHFLASEGLAGDFNDDGKVDAADYTVWRNNLNTNNALPNDDGLNVPIGQAHYDLWKDNFGMGSGGAGGVASVPEPSAMLLAIVGALGMLIRRRPLVKAS